MNGHAMDQGAEIANERSAVILGLSVVSQDSSEPVHRFDVPIQRSGV